MTPQELPLRDIHLPEPVGWWPPAPGWWWVAALGIVLVLAVWLAMALRKRGQLRRHALMAFEEITRDYQQRGNTQALCQSLSVLLRRISLSLYPRTQVASLSGEDWLRFLQQKLPEKSPRSFIDGPGRVLAEAPFNPQLEVDGEKLLATCHRWILITTRQGGVS